MPSGGSPDCAPAQYRSWISYGVKRWPWGRAVRLSPARPSSGRTPAYLASRLIFKQLGKTQRPAPGFDGKTLSSASEPEESAPESIGSASIRTTVRKDSLLQELRVCAITGAGFGKMQTAAAPCRIRLRAPSALDLPGRATGIR